ncbi:unnamed protein product [Phytophthora lilii]|uniref:Unnamed protein product n=1 Tax=Phytophthora lilii TaxID=2077276 RepID=A0A9W6WML8_9STRA|nr:unnamed protein product [Phytophthora lilii]
MKCEELGVQLPEVGGAVLPHHALGYLQIPKAVDHIRDKFGAETAATTAAATPLPRVVRRQKRTLMQDMPKRNRRNLIVESDSDSDEGSSDQSGRINAMSPVASSKKTKYAKKPRLQEQVEANPAVREENQPLVDQLVQLGDYEMHHGHSQRGLSRLRAAKEIRDTTMVITSGAQAKKLERVGASVATKIDQLLNEGLSAALSEYDGDEEALPVTKAKSNTSLSQASKSLGFLPEAPPEDEGLETQDSSLVQGSNASGTQYRKSKSTPLKRLAADQKVSTRTKVAKKAKLERGLVLPEASSETEEKPAPGLQGKDTHDDSASSDAADQDIAALLELEGLDDADGVNDESSDEFTL